MYKSDYLKIVQDYSEHASNVRDTVCDKLDNCLNKKRLDREELKRLVNVFRKFKYMDAQTFLDKEGL